MSEHTPTTDTVRDSYIEGSGYDCTCRGNERCTQQYVKPSRDEMARELRYEFGSYLAHGPYDPEKFWGLAADRILALLPGKSEAEVKAEGLREAADDLTPGDDKVDDWGIQAGLLRDRADSIERG